MVWPSSRELRIIRWLGTIEYADVFVFAHWLSLCIHVSANERLVAEFQAMKKDPTIPQTDIVLSMDASPVSISSSGKPTVKVEWKTPYKHFTVWYSPESKYPPLKQAWEKFRAATENGPPETVSYVKNADNAFYRTLAFNMEADVAP